MLSNVMLVSSVQQHESALSIHIFWRRKWQPTSVFLPRKSHGWRSLVGYSPWGCKESDMTEKLHFHFQPRWSLTSLKGSLPAKQNPVHLKGEASLCECGVLSHSVMSESL